MGRHNKLNVKNFRKRQKLKKAIVKRNNSSFPSISTPGEDSTKSTSQQVTKEISGHPNNAATTPQKVDVLRCIYNDPLYIKMNEYLLLKARLAAITKGQ